jgi:hypothetical protein
VRVGTCPGVVGQVETRVIRILVDHDRIGIPNPIGDERKIVWKNAKVGAPEPESIRAAAFKAEDMTRSEAQREAPVFPGTVHVIASIITTRVVTNPLAAIMHVRGLGMSLEIAEIALITSPLISAPLSAGALVRLALVRSTLFWRPLLDGRLPLFWSALLRGCLLSRSWSARRNISATDATLIPVVTSAIPAIITAPLPAVPLLRKARNCKTQREQSQKY